MPRHISDRQRMRVNRSIIPASSGSPRGRDSSRMATLISSLGLAVVVYVFAISCTKYRKLQQFDGPPLAAFSELWLFWQSWTGRLNIAEYEAIQEYGMLLLFSLTQADGQCDIG